MKKVKAVARVVHGNDKVAEPGTVFEIDDDAARSLIEAGHATEAKGDEKPTAPGTTASPMAPNPNSSAASRKPTESRAGPKTDDL